MAAALGRPLAVQPGVRAGPLVPLGRSPTARTSPVAHAKGRRRIEVPVDASLELPCGDYAELLQRAQNGNCPALLLAPMESLADRPFRMAFARTLGGFDEACTEFIRCPSRDEDPQGMARGLAKGYNGREISPHPLGAQVMGSNTGILAHLIPRLIDNGAPRIDLNCGCPAGIVTGKGAGSSMLRSPDALHEVVADLVRSAAGRVPVSVKMRSGFEDTSLFEDNLAAIESAGATFVTIHPRTRDQGYSGAADWTLLARAKRVLTIPVVGSGDVNTAVAAIRMHEETGCDGIMVGRGAIQDPFLFHRVRSAFRAAGRPSAGQVGLEGDELLRDEAAGMCRFLRDFARLVCSVSQKPAGPSCRMKQLAAYYCMGTPGLESRLKEIQRGNPTFEGFDAYLDQICSIIMEEWSPGGLQSATFINHMSLAKRKQRPNGSKFIVDAAPVPSESKRGDLTLAGSPK